MRQEYPTKTKKHVTTLRMTKDEFRQVLEIARQKNLSMNKMVMEILRKELKLKPDPLKLKGGQYKKGPKRKK